jgi:hypothetical protein
MHWLCNRIQQEQDPEIFDALVREFIDLFEINRENIHPEHKTNPN